MMVNNHCQVDLSDRRHRMAPSSVASKLSSEGCFPVL